MAGLLGNCNEDEDKNGKALFLVMLSYEESQECSDKRLLIGTQILEGFHYVELPDGSRMFVLLLHIDIYTFFNFIVADSMCELEKFLPLSEIVQWRIRDSFLGNEAPL